MVTKEESDYTQAKWLLKSQYYEIVIIPVDIEHTYWFVPLDHSSILHDLIELNIVEILDKDLDNIFFREKITKGFCRAVKELDIKLLVSI